DMEQYRGKLNGKIVLLGEMRDVKPIDKPLFVRVDEKDLASITEYPTAKRPQLRDQLKDFLKDLQLREKVGKFLAEEQALVVIVPSRDGRDSGGSGGTVFDDSGSDMSWFAYKR